MVRLAGAGALLATFAIGAVSYTNLLAANAGDAHRITLIIGDWFPTMLDLAITTTAVGVGALVTAAMLAPPDPARPGRPGRATRIGAVVALAALVFVSLAPTAIVSGGQLLNQQDFSVLPGTSAGGCRIIVREWSFLLAGAGSAGIIQPGSMVVEWVRDYRADDGIRPFSSGGYFLEWDDRTADLDLHSISGNPVWWTRNGPLVCNH